MRVCLYFSFVILSVLGSGCSVVQPWERSLLSKPEMQLTQPFETAYDEHIYFSKEASSGGQGFAAGGCGCN